jgi:hypothetical protein
LFVAVVVVSAVGLAYARGGRLSRLAEAPLHRPWLLFLGVGLQVVVDVLAARGVIGDAGALGSAGLIVSQLLVIGFLASNWQLPGTALVAVGLMMNAVVMAANGAMPVDPVAIQALGIEGATVPLGKHTLLTGSTRLPWLADIWPVPPLRSIISAGDVVLAAGMIPITHALMTHRPTAEHRGRSPVSDAG